MAVDDNKKVFQQDLINDNDLGRVFIIHLFFEEKCDMPDAEFMTQIMSKHLGEVECFCHNETLAGFAPKNYMIKTTKGLVPPQLMIMKCTNSTEDLKIDDFTKSQMWNCPDSDEIFKTCKYHVVATELLTSLLDYKDRANLLMDYAEAVAEMYPTCKAVLFRNSEKMFLKEDIVNHNIPKESRFIYFAVNVRFFNIHGTNDHIVDSLGMSTLFLPDVQYHFHDVDPDSVVNHAYNLLQYIYQNNCPIKSGETVDGLKNGVINQSVQWDCHYEDSLIQPSRDVLDVCMGEFASGKRGE